MMDQRIDRNGRHRRRPGLCGPGRHVALLSLVLAAALFAAAFGGRTARLLAAGALAWVAIVALMTTAGYAGNPRYLVAAAAIGAAANETKTAAMIAAAPVITPAVFSSPKAIAAALSAPVSRRSRIRTTRNTA